MSLGSFFRDYVYIPLGGNRRHQLFNIVCVWFLTGMWHGASWNFILWGLFFGFILVVEKFVLKNVLTKTPALLLHIYTLLIVTLSFGIFYFDSMPRMGIFFSSAFGGSESFFGFVDKAALMDNFWLWVVAILLCMPIRKQLGTWLGRVGGENSALAANLTMVVRLMISIAILVLSVALLVGATNNAFLYTRF
jgi:alginate O-acetyltransferase complex protein AlgI